MSKKSYIIILIALFIVFIMVQFVYSTTFRIESLEDKATLIRVWNDCGLYPCPPMVTAEGDVMVPGGSDSGGSDSGGSGSGVSKSGGSDSGGSDSAGGICSWCHARKPAPKVKITAKDSVNRHLKMHWPRNEYRLSEGQRVSFINTNAYVIKRKGRLVLYENRRPSVLKDRAKIIKAGNRFFILE